MRPWTGWSRVWLAVLFCLAALGLAGGGFWVCASAQGDSLLERPLEEVSALQGGTGVPEAWHGVTLTVWISEVVTTAVLAEFRGDALQFDGMGHPGFVYATVGGEPPTTTVYFAQEKETTWQVEAVGTGADAAPTLAFDAANRPHISYVRGGAIYHAWRDGDVWTNEVVDTGKGPVEAAAIAANNTGAGELDAAGAGAGVTGTIGIAFSMPDEEPPALYLAQTQGGSWNVETVMTGTQEGGWQVSWFWGDLDFAYDSAGRPHIGFRTGIMNMPRQVQQLRHTAKADGVWRSSIVASDMAVWEHALSMGDPLGGFAAYTTFGPPCVIPCARADETGVAWLAADGSTSSTIYTFRSDSNRLQGLAVYGGIPNIALEYQYRVGTDGEAPLRRELWHVRIGHAWPESTLLAVDDFTGAMLAMDGQGVPLMVYMVPSSHQFVAVRPVPVAFAHAQWLPFVGRAP